MVRILMFSLVSLFIISCSKDDDTIVEETAVPDFSIPLAVGNYWIYQTYTEDMNGDLQPNSSPDSMFISGMQKVDEEEYYAITGFSVGSVVGVTLVKDSLGYLVNDSGDILYSPEETDEVLFEQTFPISNDANIYVAYTAESDVAIETPAGSFDTRMIVGTVDFSETIIDCENQNLSHYAEGVGRVREELFYASNCRVVYRELLRYNIQ